MNNFKHLLGHFSRTAWRDYLFITIGTFLQALAIRQFLVYGHLLNVGISRLAQLINYYTRFPIGVMILIENIPLLLLGWRHLGGRRPALRTPYTVLTDSFLPQLCVRSCTGLSLE